MPERKPIKSRADYSPGQGANMFVAFNNLELMGLIGQLFFNHHDLCRLHGAVVAQTNKRYEQLDTYLKNNKTFTKSNVDIDSYEAIIQSRIRETATSWEMEIESVQGFGDQLFVVGLWAIAEQYLTRALDIAQRWLSLSQPVPYKWEQIKKQFQKIGVNLEQCKGFSDANECRILNNKVKHLGIVDNQLAKFNAFQNHIGEPLSRILIDLQRYSNGIFEFVGCTIEETDKFLKTSDAG